MERKDITEERVKGTEESKEGVKDKVDNTLKGESTEERKEDSKDKMENTWKGQIKKG
jgi:hypothetical protein